MGDLTVQSQYRNLPPWPKKTMKMRLCHIIFFLQCSCLFQLHNATAKTTGASPYVRPAPTSIFNLLGMVVGTGSCGGYWHYLSLNNYGNFCGYTDEHTYNTATPVGDLDNCCLLHDQCFDDRLNDGCDVYNEWYSWSGDTADDIMCKGKEGCVGDSCNGDVSCKMGVCECDKVFSQCVERELKKKNCEFYP